MAKCICELCSCGRHRCPHKQKTRITPQPIKNKCFLTEYSEAFPKWPQQKPRSTKRPVTKPKQTTSQPMENQSTYRDDYIIHKMEPSCRRTKRKKQEYTPPSEPMDIITLYKHDFNRKKGQRLIPIRPVAEMVIGRGPMSKTSYYQDAFKAWTAEELRNAKVNSCRPKENNADLLSGFGTDTNVNKVETNQKSVEKETQDTVLKNPGDKTTDEIEIPATTTVKQYTSTYRDDFHSYENARREGSFKPAYVPVSTGCSFDGRTVQSLSYKPWPVQPKETPKWAKRPEYKQPAVKFFGKSCYEEAYRRPECYQRPMLVLPQKNDIFEPAPEAGDSDATRGTATTAVLYDTTYRRDYSEWKDVQPALICRPEERPHSSREKMRMTTTYRETFTGQRPHSCPAASLRTTASKSKNINVDEKTFQLAYQGSGGHKYFTELAVPDTPLAVEVAA